MTAVDLNSLSDDIEGLDITGAVRSATVITFEGRITYVDPSSLE
jgi:hypothetical protein